MCSLGPRPVLGSPNLKEPRPRVQGVLDAALCPAPDTRTLLFPAPIIRKRNSSVKSRQGLAAARSAMRVHTASFGEQRDQQGPRRVCGDSEPFSRGPGRRGAVALVWPPGSAPLGAPGGVRPGSPLLLESADHTGPRLGPECVGLRHHPGFPGAGAREKPWGGGRSPCSHHRPAPSPHTSGRRAARAQTDTHPSSQTPVFREAVAEHFRPRGGIAGTPPFPEVGRHAPKPASQ